MYEGDVAGPACGNDVLKSIAQQGHSDRQLGAEGQNDSINITFCERHIFTEVKHARNIVLSPFSSPEQ